MAAWDKGCFICCLALFKFKTMIVNEIRNEFSDNINISFGLPTAYVLEYD